MIYLSELVKDVFGFVVFAKVFEAEKQTAHEDLPYLTIALGVGNVSVLYASRKRVEKERVWPIIGRLPVTLTDEELLVHGVGGTLYRGNEEIRPFSSIEERKQYPQILTYGDRAIENVLDLGFKQAGLYPCTISPPDAHIFSVLISELARSPMYLEHRRDIQILNEILACPIASIAACEDLFHEVMSRLIDSFRGNFYFRHLQTTPAHVNRLREIANAGLVRDRDSFLFYAKEVDFSNDPP